MHGKNLKYLQELVYGDMEERQAVAGFIEHYVLEGKSLNNLYSDVCLLSCSTAAKEVNEKITRGLGDLMESLSWKPEQGISFAEMLEESEEMEEGEAERSFSKMFEDTPGLEEVLCT